MGGVVSASRRAGRRGPRARSGVPAPDQWLIWSCRCQIPAFTDLARKISKHAARSKAHYDLSNALVESSNTKIRLLTRIESSCKSPEALIAFVMLPRRLPTLTARRNQPRLIHEIRIAVTTSRSLSVWSDGVWSAEPVHQRGTCRAPEMFGWACWERAADLERRQALTQSVKRGCGLIHLQCSEASAILEPGHPCLQNEPRAFARRLDAGKLLVGGVRLREADLEQRGVVEDQPAESADPDLHEIGRGISCRRKPVHSRWSRSKVQAPRATKSPSFEPKRL